MTIHEERSWEGFMNPIRSPLLLISMLFARRCSFSCLFLMALPRGPCLSKPLH